MDELLISVFKELVVRGLTQPEPGVATKTHHDGQGNTYYADEVVLGPSVIQQMLKDITSSGNTRDQMARVVLEHIKANPDIFNTAIRKLLVDVMIEHDDRGYGRKPSAIQADMRRGIQDAVRTAAANILQNDEEFTARAMDMAHLSDTDRIDIKIELKPAGQ